ncbi:methylmalonyl-CoA epimerase [Micromonospora sp. WMMD1155]|uniref:methylmalonyl-CoA epimerase n=1 Tax=Micromonospora sp. WMMD1155 TaxID=3016094 RepID=UPI00249B3B3E|nr:methylmalonyl-CoA epimerase [Micromonospora sp. WMMD1155]WFE54838.1 methylmalonyl-CoA epimerase [Micromonospora sp. WMMD1155]
MQSAGLLRVDHVGIAVADLDEAIDFYQRVLGMRLEHRETNTVGGVHEATLVVGDDTPGARIQLLAPAGPESPVARFLDRRGPGLQQIAYEVADVEASSRALQQMGIPLLFASPQLGTAGSRVNFIHPGRAGGVLVELVEPAAAPRAGG